MSAEVHIPCVYCLSDEINNTHKECALRQGGTCLFGRLKIWVFKWEENEVLFFKCEEMKNG